MTIDEVLQKANCQVHSTTPTTTPEKPSKKQKGGVKKSVVKKSVAKEEAKKSHDAKMTAANIDLKLFESTPHSKQPPKTSEPDESAAMVGLKMELEMLKRKLAERTGEHAVITGRGQ